MRSQQPDTDLRVLARARARQPRWWPAKQSNAPDGQGASAHFVARGGRIWKGQAVCGVQPLDLVWLISPVDLLTPNSKLLQMDQMEHLEQLRGLAPKTCSNSNSLMSWSIWSNRERPTVGISLAAERVVP
jgi:hypothetical protein